MIKKLPKVILSVWDLFAIGVGCLLPITIALIWWSSPVKENDWKSRTSPLPRDIVIDICSKFDAEAAYSSCKSNEEVYAPDLFPVIKNAFLSNQSSTYEDVQLVLGEYQSDFEPPVTLGNGEQYFVSWYDLRGDGATAIVFFFNGDGSIQEIEYHLGNVDD